jgi:hypothetical protein
MISDVKEDLKKSATFHCSYSLVILGENIPVGCASQADSKANCAFGAVIAAVARFTIIEHRREHHV